MNQDTIHRIASYHAELIKIRRDIHAHPELGMEETRTAALVAAKLREWGVAVTEGVGKLGVVGSVQGSRPAERSIGLRADMDALAMEEQTCLPYASQNHGKMHACGHDGHTTLLLGAARYFAENRDFSGTVNFIFQPAEEGRGGATAMLDDGLLERFPCDAVYGLHNIPGLPAGTFATFAGPLMAGVGWFEVTFRGTGGHGGMSPASTTDLTIVQANYVVALRELRDKTSNDLGLTSPVVIRVCCVSGGQREAFAVMPAELYVSGTFRCFSTEIQTLLERRIHEIAHATAGEQGATAEVKVHRITPPLINPADQTRIAVEAAQAVVGVDNVITAGQPVTAGEDFAFMMQARPGAFMFLGNGIAADGSFHNIHTPKYDFNDQVIPLGVAYWVSLVQQQLAAGEESAANRACE